jgi:hypothetical protein
MSQSPIIPGVKARVGAQFNFNGKTDVIAAFDCGTYYTPLEKTSIYSIGYRIEFFYQRDSLSSIVYFKRTDQSFQSELTTPFIGLF